MQILDISISKTAKPTPTEHINTGPTLERINKSDATIGGVTEDGARWFKDELLVRLADKGKLYPDAKINAACHLAGEKYYTDWYGSGMGGLQAIDYGKGWAHEQCLECIETHPATSRHALIHRKHRLTRAVG